MSESYKTRISNLITTKPQHFDEYPKKSDFEKIIMQYDKQMAVGIGQKLRNLTPHRTGEVLRLCLSLSKVFSRSTDFSRWHIEDSPENKLQKLAFCSGVLSKSLITLDHFINDYAECAMCIKRTAI